MKDSPVIPPQPLAAPRPRFAIHVSRHSAPVVHSCTVTSTSILHKHVHNVALWSRSDSRRRVYAKRSLRPHASVTKVLRTASPHPVPCMLWSMAHARRCILTTNSICHVTASPACYVTTLLSTYLSAYPYQSPLLSGHRARKAGSFN